MRPSFALLLSAVLLLQLVTAAPLPPATASDCDENYVGGLQKRCNLCSCRTVDAHSSSNMPASPDLPLLQHSPQTGTLPIAEVATHPVTGASAAAAPLQRASVKERDGVMVHHRYVHIDGNLQKRLDRPKPPKRAGTLSTVPPVKGISRPRRDPPRRAQSMSEIDLPKIPRPHSPPPSHNLASRPGSPMLPHSVTGSIVRVAPARPADGRSSTGGSSIGSSPVRGSTSGGYSADRSSTGSSISGGSRAWSSSTGSPSPWGSATRGSSTDGFASWSSAVRGHLAQNGFPLPMSWKASLAPIVSHVAPSNAPTHEPAPAHPPSGGSSVGGSAAGGPKGPFRQPRSAPFEKSITVTAPFKDKSKDS